MASSCSRSRSSRRALIGSVIARSRARRRIWRGIASCDHATVRRLMVLGFPKPGDAYWRTRRPSPAWRRRYPFAGHRSVGQVRVEEKGHVGDVRDSRQGGASKFVGAWCATPEAMGPVERVDQSTADQVVSCLVEAFWEGAAAPSYSHRHAAERGCFLVLTATAENVRWIPESWVRRQQVPAHAHLARGFGPYSPRRSPELATFSARRSTVGPLVR